jgi:hypothetical protein
MEDERRAQIDGVFGARRLVAAFRFKKATEKRQELAALQRLPPFQVKYMKALHNF